MAQHINIVNYPQKKMRKFEEGIRKVRHFNGSLKYQELPDDYKQSKDDKVYVTYRTVPESIVWGGKAAFEVHTTPLPTGGRLATNIYLVA